MKNLILIIFLLFLQQDYQELKELFPKIKYDENGNFLTRSLNAKTYVDLKQEFKRIPDALSFKYLCDSDTSKFIYKYRVFNMDEDQWSDTIRQKFDHYSILRFKKENYDFLIYSKYNTDDQRLFMRSFDSEGHKTDELLINEVAHSETGIDLSRVRFSLIKPDSIKIFNYYDAENPNREDKKTPLVTKVVIEDYAIDSIGRFNKVAVDSMLLSKPMRAYTEFIHMPEGDDPARKYWTLW